MVAFRALTVLLAFASPILVHADVTPSEPGPGSVFNAGSKCRVTWQGDADSPTAWKEMAIELMSGSNLAMVHITTVTTGQDGTKDGAFEYTCPEVTPYSAIYFYQFTSPHTPVKTWTTRFAIASATGETTPPANPKQPGSGDAIPWGVGNLVDQTKAVPAPAFAKDGPSSSASLNSTTVASSTRLSSVIVTGTKAAQTSSTSSPSSSTSAKGSTSTTTSDALSSSFVDGKLWMTALMALVFTATF